MKYYRLTKDAVKFFHEEHATKIYTKDIWDSIGVDVKALEEVKSPYLNYGIKKSESLTTCGGWSEADGTHFEFTIHFPSVKFKEHDRFMKGRMTRELMDRIQSAIDNFYTNFVNEETEP